MLTSDITHIIQRNIDSIAFVIGNGINRYSDPDNRSSWNELLIKLWDKVSFRTLSHIPPGISLTEFYDILDFENRENLNLQKEFCGLMSEWEPLEHHKLITNRIISYNAPILTTNFETTLAKSSELSLYRTEYEGFTDYYPWTSYHGDHQINSPMDGFGIWYINGMINYHRSIMLGLSQYLGSVERANHYLHKDSEKKLFAARNKHSWKGNKTWLQLIFNKSLFIMGLGLEENETFLRWLLIERSKYFRKFPRRKQKGWYLVKKNDENQNAGKRFFLEMVGIEVIEVDSYENIYVDIWK